MATAKTSIQAPDGSTAASPAAFIQARNVTKTFYRDKFAIKALNDVSLDIRKGEFLALMGPSGSGKTTLLNLIAVVDRPTSGELLVNNESISNLGDAEIAKWRNRHIGYVFQTFNLIPVLTAFENVELALLRSGLTKTQRREHVLTALELVGLQDRADHQPRQLSGGQEQRVAIARAIVTDPEIILADEPTGDLDSAAAAEVMQLMKLLNKNSGKTVIIVTHDAEAAAYADTVRHLEKGVLQKVKDR